MTEQPRILICDDEPAIREMVADYLGPRGMAVDAAASAGEMRALIAEQAPDAIILDLNMPKEDGLTALRSLRAGSDVPVILMTAANEVIDRVVGLEMGADDYLGKPVDLRELEARLKVLLRRHASPQAPVERTGAVPFGTCQLDLDGARLIDGDGQEVYLTAMEFNLLRVFARNRGRVLNRDQLLEQAHDKSWEPFDRSIDLRISRIRRKIEVNPAKPEVIRTVRGIGYVFG